MDRVRRYTLLAAILLAAGQISAWLLDSVAPDFPHFMRFLVFLFGVKLLGDIVYFALWPQRREWVNPLFYLWEDFFDYIRVGFPVAVAQRLVETTVYPPYVYEAPPATVTHILLAGPYVAVVAYMVNRWLREEVGEHSYSQARQFLHLP